MESISKCCEALYRHPFDRRNVMLCGGVVLVVLFFTILYWVFAGGAARNEESPGSEALKNVPFIDGFNNLPYTLKLKVYNNLKNVNLGDNLTDDKVLGSTACSICKTDLARLKAGHVQAQFWSAGVDCASAGKDAVSQTLEQIDAIHRLVRWNNKYLFLGRSDYDIENAAYYEKIASFITVNGGHSIDGRLGVLRTFYDLGVRSMSLTSECNTTWANCYLTKPEVKTGLGDFGKKVVAEMNRLGMIIDLTGTSNQTQLDVLQLSKAPVIFSHSASFELLQHPRNIQNDVLLQLKGKNGIIMVTFEPKYVCSSLPACTLNEVVDLLNRLKQILGGVDNIGIGAAFDSYDGGYPKYLEDVSKYGALFDRLHNNGDLSWSISDLEKIASSNFRRVMKAVEEVRDQMSDSDLDESYEPLANITERTCYSDFNVRYPDKDTKPAKTSDDKNSNTGSNTNTNQGSNTNTNEGSNTNTNQGSNTNANQGSNTNANQGSNTNTNQGSNN